VAVAVLWRGRTVTTHWSHMPTSDLAFVERVLAAHVLDVVRGEDDG